MSKTGQNSEILFFILVFLLLFYDNRPLLALKGDLPAEVIRCGSDSSILFFIIIFLLLFYD